MPKTPLPPPPLPGWFPPVVSLVCIALFLLHASGTVTFDAIALLLLAGAVLVWVLPNLTKVKLGDLELDLKVDALIAAQAEPEGDPPPFGPKDWLFTNAINEIRVELPDLRPADADPNRDPVPMGRLVLPQAAPQRQSLRAALGASRYPLRNETGLMRDTGMEAAALRQELQALQDAGAAVGLTDATGRRLWGLTAAGRAQT